MGNTTIGAMLSKLRYEKGYSRRKLCSGLCSTQILMKIEQDEADVDKFMLDILLQRLGKSPDKLEVLLSDEEYEKLCIRDEIEEKIWKKEKEAALNQLAVYENRYAPKSGVQKMFVLRMRAYISRYIEQDIKEAEGYIRKAVEMTLPQINSSNMKEYLLSGMEMENLFALGRCLIEQEKDAQAEELLNACQEYLDACISDEEEYAKLNGKCVWLRARLLVKKKEYLKAIQICEQAMDQMRKYGVLYFMLPLLEQLVFCGRELGMDESKNKWNIYYEVLRELYQEYGEPWFCQDALFHNCHETVYHLVSEFIRQERQVRELTQEQLIEGVYEAAETLSRIESGKVVPEKKKLDRLMEKLGIERGKYCGAIAVESLEMLQIKHEIDILIGTGKYERAWEAFEYLKKNLDDNKKQNVLTIEIYEILISVGLKKVDEETTVLRLKELLAKQRLLKEGKLYRIPFFNELLALNMLCRCLKRMGKMEEADAIYAEIIRVVRQGKIGERYQNKIMSVILANKSIENVDIKFAKEGIAYELFCAKGKMLYMHVASYAELLEETAQKKLFRQAYYLSDLFLRGENRLILKKDYEESYGESLL